MKKFKATLVREVMETCPDGSGIKRIEFAEAIIEIKENKIIYKKKPYTTKANWIIVDVKKNEEAQKIRIKDISEMTCRLYFQLKKHNFIFIDEAARKTDKELLSFNGLGRKCLHELKEIFISYNISRNK